MINILKKYLDRLVLFNETTNTNPFVVSEKININNPIIKTASVREYLNNKQIIICYKFNTIKYDYYYPKYIIVYSDNTEKVIKSKNINSTDHSNNSLIIPEDIKTNKPIKGVGFYIEKKEEDKIFGFDISFDSNTNKYIIGSLIKLKENLMEPYNLYLEDGNYVENKRGGGNKTIKKKVFLNNKTKHKKHFNP